MQLGFTFRQTMSGSYWRLDAPTDERAIAFAVEAATRDMGAFLHDRTLRLKGTIDAEQLARGKPLDGTLSIKLLGERRIAYHVAFVGDDGRRYELSGQKEWSWFSPIESLTLLSASLYEERGDEIARARLRFDIRSDGVEWAKSFRARWDW